MIRLSLPSKTFLLGEYGVLQGGQALLVATTPRFEMILRPASRPGGLLLGMDCENPTARWIKEREDVFSEWDIEFKDPFLGSGGLGASSAQFLMTYLIWRSSANPSGDLDPVEFLKSFRECMGNNDGPPPSGADLFVQWLGGCARVNPTTGKYKNFEWPWPEVGFSILKTGEKIRTHEHLASLKSHAFSDIADLTDSGISAFESGEFGSFVEALREMNQLLIKKDLVSLSTLEKIAQIKKRPEVLAAKGCGAFGADVILVLTPIEKRKTFHEWIASTPLTLVATEENLSSGFQVHNDSQGNVIPFISREVSP